MRDVLLIRCVDPAALDRVVARAELTLARHAGQRPPAIEIWRHARSGMALLQVASAGELDRVPIHQTRREAFTYAGFVADRRFSASDVRRLISLDSAPTMKASPGGMATCFLADASSRRAVAWSSHA